MDAASRVGMPRRNVISVSLKSGAPGPVADVSAMPLWQSYSRASFQGNDAPRAPLARRARQQYLRTSEQLAVARAMRVSAAP